MGKSKAQKVAEEMAVALGITVAEARERLDQAEAAQAEEAPNTPTAEEPEPTPTEEEAPEAESAPEAEPEPEPEQPPLAPLAVNPVDEADMAREAQERELRTPGIPKNVSRQIKEWLGESRGVADTSQWDGKSITVVSYPDYQKHTFYRQASSE